MTEGQQRALREIQSLCASMPNDIELVGEPTIVDDRLRLVVSLRIGPIETRQGGLELLEREEFIIRVPPDFPFDYPTVLVAHDRFARFPHVIWSRRICLFRQAADWNPRAGVYGFFDKLRLWLAKAALNEMDPVDLPLEPPHHVTAFSQVPFVVRANAPVVAGESWIGFAQLQGFPNRMELVGWTDLDENWPAGKTPALAVILPEALPLEFPETCAGFFDELAKQNIDRDTALKYLTVAAMLAEPGLPLHLVLGVPMRRSADGELRLHVAVWTISAERAKALRLTIEAEDDPPTLKECRKELAEIVYKYIETDQAVFCRILDDRPEIVIRRDNGRPVSWFAHKRVLLIGCGALGSWIGEIVARADAALIHLIDNGIVEPGILARQNFQLTDIAADKAEALAKRLSTLSRTEVTCTATEAHEFIMEDLQRFNGFDVVIDCTASSIFQMKLERDWRRFSHATPPMISIGIDAEATRCIAVTVPRNSAGGVWDAYLQLQRRLCIAATNGAILNAFYSERAGDRLFQPEPGCSEPTFVGSTADVAGLAASAINLAAQQMFRDQPSGLAFSAPNGKAERLEVDVIELAHLIETNVGNYRIRTASNVYREARAWVQQNNRLRTADHETGGLLWGLWDDAVEIIWVFDASGPPADSKHDPGRFTCGVEGTTTEHVRRMQQTENLCGFVGLWHTHPEMAPVQSGVDIGGMAALVSRVGHNQRRCLMLIFGRAAERGTVAYYVYESHGTTNQAVDLVSVAVGQIDLDERVV